MAVVSVIVPVYKTQAYLPACIESILAQTFMDFELILVDDGSPDDCPALCDAAAELDSRVRVLHQENAGANLARKNGAAAARGEHLLFVDSDDYIHPQLLETVLAARERTQADLLQFGLSRVGDGWQKDRPAPAFVMDEVELRERLLPEYLEVRRTGCAVSASLCDKLIRRELYLEAAEHTPPRQAVGEDYLTVLGLLLRCRRVASIPECLYLYRDNPASVTSGYSIRRRSQEADFWSALVSIAEGAGYDVTHHALSLERRYVDYVFDCCVSRLPFEEKRREVQTLCSLLCDKKSLLTLGSMPTLARRLVWRMVYARLYGPAILLGGLIHRADKCLHRQ